MVMAVTLTLEPTWSPMFRAGRNSPIQIWSMPGGLRSAVFSGCQIMGLGFPLSMPWMERHNLWS